MKLLLLNLVISTDSFKYHIIIIKVEFKVNKILQFLSILKLNSLDM